jgi:ABC-2 type transport system permease protein
MNKIITIIQKEWLEVFKNKMVLFSVLFMPLLFTALPLVMLYATGASGVDSMAAELPPQFERMCPPGVSGGGCFQIYLVSQFMLLFLMMPLIIPVNIAAYSIVGEKTTRSLEPLLATPITTAELLTGKNLAAVIPAVAATWLGYVIYVIGAILIVRNAEVLSGLLDPMWLIAVILVGPLMAVLSVNFSLMVSSRVNDPRVAEQLSVVVILPLLALFFGQVTGLFLINRAIILLAAVVLAAIDLGLIYLAVRLFQREAILTRWK